MIGYNISGDYMIKQSKYFWILYITFTVILIISLYKITTKQIDYKMTEEQEKYVRNTIIKITEPDSNNENIEIVNPPIEPEPDEEIPKEDLSYLQNDYWYYINQPLISVDFSSLQAKNQDTVAWIMLNGTNINYPVVQTTDNNYYLHHAYDHTNNEAGWVYMDYRNNPKEFDQNTIIYGHGMNNNTIFGSLRYIVQDWWYTNADNHTVKLSTPSENTLWQVFSVYTIPEETYYLQTKFDDNTEYNKFLNELKSRSIYEFNADLNENDKILTLSSCYNNELRVVLHAKLIKREQR